MFEIWRPVHGYAGFYEVSDSGRVCSLGRVVVRSDGQRQPIRERILSQAIVRSGSGRESHSGVALARNGGLRTRSVAVLVLEAFVGPRPDGADACHNDGNIRNNDLTNLRWDTRAANIRDSVAHGTHRNAAKVTCDRGHPLVWTRNGAQRYCPPCHNEKARARYAARVSA